MKRGPVIVVSAAVIGAAGYFYFYRGVRLDGGNRAVSSTAPVENSAGRPAQIRWQMISRPDDGFRVDLPTDSKEVQVQAYNEAGGTEPVKMLFSSPDGDTTFAVTWEDDPPVARVNDGVAERTLKQARDGMLASTQTTLVNEREVSASGAPARDIHARNSGGGVLDARLIFMNRRLYALLALYPSANARREQDVVRFFNSFTPLRVGTSLPEASPPNG
jgi:hypothetical protein